MSLAILAIFRNEGDIIREFIEHHIELGVDKFYLVDNNSDDDWRSQVGDYLHLIDVELYEDVKNKEDFDSFENIQAKIYNDKIKTIKEDWVLICDLDEFTYTRQNKKLKDLLEICDKEDISQIIIPLRNFGSGKLIKQPKSVRKGFIVRNYYDGLPKNAPGKIGKYVPSMHKAIVKRENVDKVEITACTIKKGWTIYADFDLTKKANWFNYKNKNAFSFPEHMRQSSTGIFVYRHTNEEQQDKCLIVINHYMIQSNEKYINTKMQRGIIACPVVHGNETIHDFWIRRYKTIERVKQVRDTELRDMVIENEQMARRKRVETETH